MARGGDFEDLVAAGFQFRADELGHVLAVRQVHLVQGHEAGAVVQRNDFAVGPAVAHVHRVLLQLGLDDGEVGERIAVRFERAAVQHVHQGGAALDVAQEVVAQALALAGALDQAGDVGDGEADFAGLDDAQVGDEGGEGIVRDLGPGGGHRGDQAGLAGARGSRRGRCPRWTSVPGRRRWIRLRCRAARSRARGASARTARRCRGRRCRRRRRCIRCLRPRGRRGRRRPWT